MSIEIEKVQDINIDDSSIKNSFVNYFMNNQIESAFSLLNNSQLDNKKFIAQVINDISNALTLLQSNSVNNFETYLQNILNQFQTLVDNFILLGQYNSSNTYQRYNFVIYNNDIYMYIYNTPSSTIPTNTTYWVKMEIQGEQGGYGIGLNLRGVWSSGSTYSPLDCVSYNGSLWECLQSNSNTTPSENSFWTKVIDFDKISIYINENEIPQTERCEGIIWFEII